MTMASDGLQDPEWSSLRALWCLPPLPCGASPLWLVPAWDLAGGVQIDIDLRQIKSLLLAGRIAGAYVQAAQGQAARTLDQDAAIDRQGRRWVRRRRPGVDVARDDHAGASDQCAPLDIPTDCDATF